MKINYSMYNSDFECTYYNYDNKLKKSIKNNDKIIEENLDLAEEKYRNEFLQVFGVSDICDDSINIMIKKLYERIISVEPMIEIFKKLAAIFISEDLEIGLMVGFSYDYFFLVHPCICDYLKNGFISQENLNTLKRSLD